MVTDKELLELAAKSAGFPYGTFKWNPLTDDGDALRLAVKLDLLGSPDVAHHIACERFFTPGVDPYAATRRAIVRAAAEIGKNSK